VTTSRRTTARSSCRWSSCGAWIRRSSRRRRRCLSGPPSSQLRAPAIKAWSSCCCGLRSCRSTTVPSSRSRRSSTTPTTSPRICGATSTVTRRWRARSSTSSSSNATSIASRARCAETRILQKALDGDGAAWESRVRVFIQHPGPTARLPGIGVHGIGPAADAGGHPGLGQRQASEGRAGLPVPNRGERRRRRAARRARRAATCGCSVDPAHVGGARSVVGRDTDLVGRSRGGRPASRGLDRTSRRRQLDGPAQSRWGRRRCRAVPARSVTPLELRPARRRGMTIEAARPPGHLGAKQVRADHPPGARRTGRPRPRAPRGVAQRSPVGAVSSAVETGCPAGMASAPPVVSGSIVWAS
jgi:hypothetical protein